MGDIVPQLRSAVHGGKGAAVYPRVPGAALLSGRNKTLFWSDPTLPFGGSATVRGPMSLPSDYQSYHLISAREVQQFRDDAPKLAPRI